MIAWLSNISPVIMAAVVAGLTAVILAMLGAFFSHKKNTSEMTTKNIEGARIIWDKYDKDITALKNRVKSLEQNEAMNEHRMMEMEIAQGKLKEEGRQKDIKIQSLLVGIEKLTAQALRHESKPDWKPEDN